MSESGETVSLDQVRDILSYDPLTGIFRWKNRRSNRVAEGDVAGTVTKKGYIHIGIKRRYYKAHRLAWLVMTGDWPTDQVDHKDLDRTNNKWDNLRPATNGQNTANVRARIRNACGFKGVHRLKGRGGWVGGWRAQIRVSGKLIHLGVFKTPEEANDAYAIASQEYFGEFARAA